MTVTTEAPAHMIEIQASIAAAAVRDAEDRAARADAEKHIADAKTRIGITAWRMVGPDIRQALACEMFVRSMSHRSTEDNSVAQARRMIAVSSAIMSADFDA